MKFICVWTKGVHSALSEAGQGSEELVSRHDIQMQGFEVLDALIDHIQIRANKPNESLVASTALWKDWVAEPKWYSR